MIDDIKAPPGGGRPIQRGSSSQEGDNRMSEDIDTAAIEATGATPATGEGSAERLVVDSADLGEDTGSSTDGSEKLVVTSEDVADTAPEIGGTAVGETLGDLLTSDSDGESDEDDGGESGNLSDDTEGLIKDKDMAEEMAYAEKPFQDAKVESREVELTEQEKEFLDKMSSEASEKAMSDYIESKSKMSDAEAVLRENADLIKLFAQGLTAEQFAGAFKHLGIAKDEAESLVIARDAESLIGRMVDEGLEDALTDVTMTNEERLERIKSLAHVAQQATEFLKRGSSINHQIVAETVHNLKEAWPKDKYVAYLRGVAVGAMTCGVPKVTLDAFAEISEATGQPIHELVDKYLPEISRGKKRWDSRFNSSGGLDPMESAGYLWSKAKDRYVRIAE